MRPNRARGTTSRDAREAAIVLLEAATEIAGTIGEIAHARMTEGTDETIGETAQDREAIGGVRGHGRGPVVEIGEGAPTEGGEGTTRRE